MINKIFLFCSLFVMFGFNTAFSAGFEDPWEKGSGFDNPFGNEEPKKKESVKQPAEQKKSSSEKSILPAQQKPDMPPPVTAPNQPQFPEQPMQKQNPAQRQDNPAIPRKPDASNPIYNQKTNSGQTQSLLTPFGNTASDNMEDVKSSLMAANFKHGGKCGDGDIYFIEPALSCAAVAVRGGGKGLVGAGTWVSRDCYKKNPLIFGMSADFAKQGKEYAEGWENSFNYPGFLSCVSKGGIGTLADIEPFLGIVRPEMTKDVVDALLVSNGAKMVKRYKNGMQYNYLGSNIFFEYCANNGKMIMIGLQVENDNPELRQKINDMNLLKSGAQYSDVVVRFEKKDNVINKIQWQCTSAENNCYKRNAS